MAAAEQEIGVAVAQAKRGLRSFAADLAIEQAEKQIKLTPETDRALIPSSWPAYRPMARAREVRTRCPPLLPATPRAFADVVTDAKLDAAALDRQFADFLGTWDGSTELRAFFVNPAIPAAQKIGILDKLNAKLGLQKELRNLLAVLIDNDRIGHVAEVAAAWRRILQEQRGIRPAEIVTARELSKDERHSLVAEVAKLAGAKDRRQLQARSSPFLAARWCASDPRSTTAACAAAGEVEGSAWTRRRSMSFSIVRLVLNRIGKRVGNN